MTEMSKTEGGNMKGKFVIVSVLLALVLAFSLVGCVPQGERGATGPQGEQGIQGVPGLPGPKGDIGPQGERGLKGEQGKQGEQGKRGYEGDEGDRGRPGAKGATGAKGAKGEPGPQGEQGEPGQDCDPQVLLDLQALINELETRIDALENLPVTVIELVDIGDSTAEWTTEEKYAGDYSVKLSMRGGWWDSPNNNAEVQISITGNPKISDINSWSYYLKTAYPDYKVPVELNVDTNGDGEIDKVLWATDATDATGDWEEWNQDTGTWGCGTSALTSWAEVQEKYGDATLLRVDLGYGPLGSNQAIDAYVDDFTINGVVYDFEPPSLLR